MLAIFHEFSSKADTVKTPMNSFLINDCLNFPAGFSLTDKLCCFCFSRYKLSYSCIFTINGG